MITLFPSRAVALTLGSISIHWYGIMYVVGFVIGVRLLPALLSYRKLKLTLSDRESLFVSIFLGVLLGGRLGYILFYGASFYLTHPAEIIAVWHGGMSSHGGFIGVLIALILYTQKQHIDFLALLDVLVIPIAIGLAFGRLGNLINGELYGTVTTLPWALHFPNVEGLRHPTQLYAMLKDLFIALICFLHLRLPLRGTKSGQTTALFLMLYGLLRFIVEIFRDQPHGYSSVFGLLLSRGQLLTIPIFVAGICIWLHRERIKN